MESPALFNCFCELPIQSDLHLSKDIEKPSPQIAIKSAQPKAALTKGQVRHLQLYFLYPACKGGHIWSSDLQGKI